MQTAETYMQNRGALYHFASDTLRDGSPLPRAGDVSRTITDIEPCARGWHASEKPLDALKYAPGPCVARVLLRGNVIARGTPVDKFVGESRETLTDYVDISDGLRRFARQCALDVIDKWDAPEIVRRYLESGDDSFRSAAWSAAAWSEASAESACSAAEARSAAWSAAWSAESACSAARSAAESAAESAAWSAWSAAESAEARSAWSAAWSAARPAQNERLAAIITEALR